MNIVYVTRLSGRKWTGPNYSVPQQIKNQAKYDNVFWYNVTESIIDNNGPVKCNNIVEFPTLKLRDLPTPFNKPDLVVFESLYYYKFYKIGKECRYRNIPYIIIPRSSLTHFAQKSKYIKKKLANYILFNRFIKNAVGIQYLTKKEYEDSTDKWNKRNIIIPNGIEKKKVTRNQIEKNKLTGVFIGRPDIYQKGIDLLLEACHILKKELLSNKVEIKIYAPKESKSKDREQMIAYIKEKSLEEIIDVKGGVFDKEKENVLINSDFFILTSRFEGHPMGLIEALSYGVPSLVTTGTNMAEEVKEFEAGWDCEIDIDSIVKALRTLIKDKNEIDKKGNNALSLSNEYRWDKLASISSDEYKKLIKVR